MPGAIKTLQLPVFFLFIYFFQFFCGEGSQPQGMWELSFLTRN